MKLNPKDYRSNVGMMVINKKKEILVGKRIDHPSEFWQMPQGGIDSKEKGRNGESCLLGIIQLQKHSRRLSQSQQQSIRKVSQKTEQYIGRLFQRGVHTTLSPRTTS